MRNEAVVHWLNSLSSSKTYRTCEFTAKYLFWTTRFVSNYQKNEECYLPQDILENIRDLFRISAVNFIHKNKKVHSKRDFTFNYSLNFPSAISDAAYEFKCEQHSCIFPHQTN